MLPMLEQKELKNLLDVRKKAMATADFTFVLLIPPEDLSQNIRIYPLRIINDIYSQFIGFLFVFQWKYSFNSASINVFVFFSFSLRLPSWIKSSFETLDLYILHQFNSRTASLTFPFCLSDFSSRIQPAAYAFLYDMLAPRLL